MTPDTYIFFTLCMLCWLVSFAICYYHLSHLHLMNKFHLLDIYICFGNKDELKNPLSTYDMQLYINWHQQSQSSRHKYRLLYASTFRFTPWVCGSRVCYFCNFVHVMDTRSKAWTYSHHQIGMRWRLASLQGVLAMTMLVNSAERKVRDPGPGWIYAKPTTHQDILLMKSVFQGKTA